jgi:hypothetical protein
VVLARCGSLDLVAARGAPSPMRLVFDKNRSGSVLKTDWFSIKTETDYGSKNGFRSVYRPVFVGFENRYCSGF